MLAPYTVVEAIRESRQRARKPLVVFWVWVETDRDGFADELRRLDKKLAIVPHVLRGSAPGFVNPDAVMNDVLTVLKSVRRDVEALQDVAQKQGGVDLVVVSRRELGLPDTSSPIALPRWFPVPDENATVSIEDLTWTATAALDDGASGLDDLRRILYELDSVLLGRLQAARQRDRRLTQSLWDSVFSQRADQGVREEEALNRIARTLEAVQNPTSYRPSASRNPTVIGRLWAHANRMAPDQLGKSAKALAGALGAVEVGDDMSLTAVLNRPSNRMDDAGVRWSFALIVTLRIACQLATAAAHADDYPRFPAILLRSTSEDLRRFLDDAVARLKRAREP